MKYQVWWQPLRRRLVALLVKANRIDKQYLWAKYALAALLVGVYTFALGDNTLLDWFRMSSRKSYLQEEIAHFESIYKADSARLSVIKTQKDRVERIARERYLMKLPGEDIYIIKTADPK